MEKSEILEQMNEIFRKTFNDQTISLTTETKAADIEEWDSLNHAVMIAAVEKHFKIRFDLMEMLGFKNVGSMVDAVYSKLK